MELKEFAQDVDTLDAWIREADHIVFFGGAGVSTASGIPDFRSKDGLYNQHDVRFDQYRPEYLLSHSCLVNEPKVYFEFHRQKMDTRKIQPNNAHKYLAALEKTGKLEGIVTQNIDGLHQKAGSRKVYEIHGSALRNYCMSCGKRYPSDYIFESKEPIPHCTCGGVIRPDITLYEEMLPDEAVENAVRAISRADLMIIAGTSLPGPFVRPHEGGNPGDHGKHGQGVQSPGRKRGNCPVRQERMLFAGLLCYNDKSIALNFWGL